MLRELQLTSKPCSSNFKKWIWLFPKVDQTTFLTSVSITGTRAGGSRKMVLQQLHSIRGKLYAFATTTHSRSIGVALCMKSTHLTPPYNHTSDIVCMFAIICGEKKCVCVCLCVLYACVCLIESLREMNESLYANAEKTKRNFRLFFFVVISTRVVSKNA